MADNPLIEVLKHYGEPVNRDSFLRLAYAGKPPARLDPESESELPQDDVRFMTYRPTTHEEVKAEEDEKLAKQEEAKARKTKK